MSVEDANKIKIIGQFSFSYDPKLWDLNKINILFTSIFQREGFEYYDLSAIRMPTFVMHFLNDHFYYNPPRYRDKIAAFFSRDETANFKAHKREILKTREELPFEVIISLSSQNTNGNYFYLCKIEILTVLYQKVSQDIASLNNSKYESKLPHILKYNVDFFKRIISQLPGTIIKEPSFEGVQSKAQIFISHSQSDENLKNFINRSFASSSVKAIYEEYEELINGKISIKKIRQDISESNAIFVVLSENVNKLTYTRDWVAFESGFGAASKKDVWVVEPIEDRDNFSFITPGLTDYLPFNTGSDNFLKYFKLVIDSYDYNFIPKPKIKGVPFECRSCKSKYNIHCPDNCTIPANKLKCPVCNTAITSDIVPSY